ncbi:MAG TPA: FliM/FliN family flagellar motor C-terminal domain-containing protein [Candidatus Acidoferrales bacterium]|nr:FliM/FliN family flagellar motor C-terminal domain-containing protein [Candidatus Acidoferrales bacterium]
MPTVPALPTTEKPGISETAWREANWLPCELSAEIPVPAFTIGDLLSLELNSIVQTRTASSADLLVRANGASLGRAELDAAGDRVAVRLTELA